MTLRIERYKHTRHWALYDGAELVVVTVYRRGAREVQLRVAAEAAATEAAQAAAARQAQELAGQARAAAQAARARDQRERPSASPCAGGLGGTPRANPLRWRRARCPACARRCYGARTPGAPRRHLLSRGASQGTDCVTETTVV